MMTIVPKSILSWDCRVLDPGQGLVADITLSSWRTRGTIALGAERFEVRREGWFGPLLLAGPQGELARARRAFSIRSAWFMHYRDRQFLLEQSSLFSRDMALYEGREVIGQVRTAGLLSRRGEVDLPGYLPLPLRMFVVWLAVHAWKRKADTNASGG